MLLGSMANISGREPAYPAPATRGTILRPIRQTKYITLV